MCGTVQHTAVRLDFLEVHALWRIRRPLKHHVLEQVRESGASFLLEPRADVVDQVNGDHGDGRVAGQDHAHSVLELVFPDRMLAWAP